MTANIKLTFCLLLTLLFAVASLPAMAQSDTFRERINIDEGWRFAYGHADDERKDFNHGLRPFFFAKAGYGDGPADPNFDDISWRKLDLPHDWAVELPFDQRASTNHGSKAVGRDFPENSIGWYRKALEIPAADKGKRIALEFDGAYRDSVVWVNGHFIGNEPSGYSGFRYDITDYINFGGRNVIAVRIDATVEEGWFYEGAGIYRHVWLTKTDPLHVAQWGTFVRAEVKGEDANLTIDVTLDNDAKFAQAFDLVHEVIDPAGQRVATQNQSALNLEARASQTFSVTLSVPKTKLWDIENPQLYTLKTSVRRKGQIIDQYDTTFGIRTVIFDPEKGFFLNGKSIKLKGTNNHQDHAGVGVALPDGLQYWRLRRLKEMGANAYRSSHNPPTPELLQAADRVGILVIDEHRMMGTSPQIRGELERMIRRDRNHPSVILWSVGNEEWALEWTPLGTHLAIEMQDIVKRMDPTRRTTVAASGSGAGTSIGADVIGFNYGAQHDVDTFHRNFPDKPAMMSEEGSTLTTRGIYFDNPSRSWLNAYDRQGRPGNSLSIEEGWLRVQARPWMSGMFIWTGFDYRGETTPFGWPAISSQFGMLDTTGAFKDTAWYLKSVWRDEPIVHILPHWNWEGKVGETMDVRTYTNGDAVELFLNGKSLGRQVMTKDSHLRWPVVYAPGTLKAVAYRNGKVFATSEVTTTGQAARIKLSPDKTALKANGTDISVIWVNVTDAKGLIIPTDHTLIRFEAKGPIRILGVGNGDPGSLEADKMAERHRYAAIRGWRSLAVDGVDNRPEVADGVEMTNWRNPFSWLPPEQQPPLTKGLVLRAQFERPQLKEGEVVTLFVGQLGGNQSLYLNGIKVAPVARDGALVVDIDPTMLKAQNSLSYVFETPEGGVPKLADASNNGGKWATLRITTPAGLWQRRVFNGWAQIIVQSTGEAGTGTLAALGDGLRGVSVSIPVK